MVVATRSYNLYQQLTSADLASTANLSGSYYNGQSNNGVGALLTSTSNVALTVDSVLTVNGDRLLLAGQTAAAQNGIWDVISAGSTGGPWILRRSNDFQCIEQMKAGQYLSINGGSTNIGQVYVLTSPLPVSFGINPITFTVSGGTTGGGTVTFSGSSTFIGNVPAWSTTTGQLDGAGITLADSVTKPVTNDALNSVVSVQNVGTFTPNNIVIMRDVGGSITESAAQFSNQALTIAACASVPVVTGNLAQFFDNNGSVTDSNVKTTDVQLKPSIKAKNTAPSVGGNNTEVYAATGLTASSIVVCALSTQGMGTNTILSYAPGTNTLSVDFLTDPGVGVIVSYIAFLVAQ